MDGIDELIKLYGAEEPKRTLAPKENDKQFRDFFTQKGFKVNRTFGKAINKGSLHPYGLAADIDFNGKSDDEIGDLVEAALQKGYRVFDERVKQPGVKQTGPHLHFERNNGSKPSSFLQGRYGKRDLKYLTDLDNARLGKGTAPKRESLDDLLQRYDTVPTETLDDLLARYDAPAPEAPETIDAQIQSTLDPNSPKKATLLTPGEQIPTLGGLDVIDVPEGKLAVNPAKGQPRSLADAIGKVQDVGRDTRGTTLLTTDAQGNELSASIVRDPRAAAEQVKLDKQMFPQAVNHELLSSDEVARRRDEQLARSLPSSIQLPNDLPETPESIRANQAYQEYLKQTGLPDSPDSINEFNTVQGVIGRQNAEANKANQFVLPSQRQGIKASKQDYGSVSKPRIVGKPTDDMNTVAVEVTVPKSIQTDEDALRFALGQTDLTPQQIDKFIADRKRDGVALLSSPISKSRTIQVPYYAIAEAKGGDVGFENDPNTFLRKAAIDKDVVTDMRMEQAQGRPSVSGVPNNDPFLLPEKDAEAELDKRIQDKDYSASVRLSRAISTPWLTLPNAVLEMTPYAKDIDPTEEKQRLLNQYGSYGKAWQAEQYYQNADALEKTIRFANQTARSFTKNLVSGTGKTVALVSDLLEKNPVQQMIPEQYRPGIRNTANLLDFGLRLATSRDAKTAYNEWERNTDATPLIKQHTFRALGEFDKAIGDDPVLKGRFLGSLADAGGSAAAFIALGAVMPSLPIGKYDFSSAISGAVQSAGSGYEEGVQSGLSEQKAKLYGVFQGLTGATEMFGAGNELAALIKNPTIRGKLALGLLEVAKKARKEGTEEFAQELFQTASGKSALEYLKDNDPSTFNKVWNALNRLPKQIADTASNEALIGLITGAGLGGATATLEQGLSRQNVKEDVPVSQPIAEPVNEVVNEAVKPNETKTPTSEKSAPVAQTPLAKDTPVEGKTEDVVKDVDSLLKYYEEAPTDLIPEAPLRPSTIEGAKNRIKEVETQLEEERRKGNTDKLTGLANQNAWEAAKERIESDPEQEVISIDVNRMKDVNDTTSHEGVNKTVLKPIGDAVQKVLEKHGIDARNGFRTGGDEFTVAVPKGKAQQVRDDIEKAFGVVNVTAEKDFTNTRTGESFKKGDVIPVTISGSFGNTVKEAEVELGKRKEESKGKNPIQRTSRTPEEYAKNGEKVTQESAKENFAQSTEKRTLSQKTTIRVGDSITVKGQRYKVNKIWEDGETWVSYGRDGSTKFTPEELADAGYQTEADKQAQAETSKQERLVNERIDTAKPDDSEAPPEKVVPEDVEPQKKPATAFDQVDLFGNKTTPQTEQKDLFDTGEAVTQSDIEGAINKLKSKAGNEAIVKDAEDAYEFYKEAQRTSTPVKDILRQQRIEGGTVADILSPQAIKFLRQMERGTFGEKQAQSPTSLEMPSPEAWHKDIITDKGINYDKVNRIAEQVISGESQIVRLDDKGERGRVLGGIRNVEASIILAANERASEDAGSESASLEMPADSGSFKLQEDAQFAHPQDLLDRAKSSITADGHIELNVEAGELLRRIAGKSNLFFALTHKRGTLIQLARKIDRKLDEFRKIGYSDAEIKVLSDLADQLREIAKNGAGITYIFDFSLPHETHHQMVFNALGDNVYPEEYIDQLSQFPVWKNPKVTQPTGQVSTFNKLYPNARGVTKAFEIAAMLDTGEIQSNDKERFLQIFAQGIRKASPEINEANFARIFQYDSTPSNARGDTEAGSERQEDRGVGKDGTAKRPEEEANQEAGTRPGDGQVQRPDSGTEVSVENKVVRQLTDYDRLFKKRKYAETLRENGYEDTPDVPYIPDTEKKWLADAQRRISASKHDDYKTAEKAFYEDNMEPQQRTALGIGLLDHLGSIGELERMIKVSEELVKHVGTAAQALRASQLAGKYDFVTGMMIATRAVKKAGKELTAKDAEKVRELLTRIAQTEEEKASLTYLNQELETAVKEADKNIKELEGALNEAQAERKVDEKTIARLKRQIATLKENRPRTYHAKQKAELERAKPDLEKILREAFSLAMNAPDTDAFKSWFGDSKVVDENGRPLVVYHGTPTGGFTEFDAGQSGRAGDPGIRGKGFYFSNNEGLADMYQTRPNHGRTGIPQTYPVYLSIRNPYDGNKDVLGLLGRGTDTSEIRRKIESSGYDGVIYILPDGKNIEFVAFNPNQIKSAIGNKGTFDPNNPSILEMPADDRVHNALVDMASLDILNYVSPEDTIEHLRDLTNNMLSEDELREIHLEAFEATKTESNITPEARKNSAVRMAHRRMAMQTAKPDVQKVRERPSRYDKEVITFGRNNGYTDKEILGAILFPKIKGAHSVSEWKKLVDGDDNTFKRSRELRQKVNNDIQDQIIKAKADREGYKGDLEKFKNEVIHNGIAGREARKAFDSYARKLGRSLGRKAFDLASETVSLFKGLSAWGEISYIGRQGFIPLLTDTRAAIKGDWKGVGHGLQGDNQLWQYLADKAGFENAAEYLSNHSLSVFVEQIRQHPRFLSAQNNGVRFTHIGDFNVADDHFSTQLLEKVPFYRRAEGAYTLPGDLQRLYIYDNWATMLEQQNLSADEMKKALKYVAETVNAFTGKGDIGKVIAKGGALSKALNLALFSPQLLFSRFQSLNKLTLGWATAPKGLKIQMAKKGLRFYGILAVIAALTGMVLDPEDEDFGKINIGDTHADLLAGLDVPAQLYLRTAMGFVKSVINQDTAYLADDIQANIREFGVSKEGQLRFARSKLSPGASLAVDAYTGTDFLGRPFTWWGGLTSRSVPLAWQQTYDALLYDRYREMVKEPRTFEYAVNKFNENERNYLNALMVMAGTFTGIGITQYPKADRSKAVQLAAQLSPFVSKKDAEQRRIEGGLRNLLADKFDLLKQGKDTRKVDMEIERWMRINPDLNKKFSAINSQAGSKTGLIALYAKDLPVEALKRVLQVADDPDERAVIEKLIRKQSK